MLLKRTTIDEIKQRLLTKENSGREPESQVALIEFLYNQESLKVQDFDQYKNENLLVYEYEPYDRILKAFTELKSAKEKVKKFSKKYPVTLARRTNESLQKIRCDCLRIKVWDRRGLSLVVGGKNVKAFLDKKEEERTKKTKPEESIRQYLGSLSSYLEKELEKIHYLERRFEPPLTEEQLLKEKHAIIIAEPGMGKSTLLDKVAFLSAKEGRIPVYINLTAAFSEEFEDFKKIIWADALSYKFHPELKISNSDLENQCFVFLFDHLDMATPQSKKNLPYEVAHINTLSAERAECGDIFIVCCRSNFDEYYVRLDNFRKFVLRELDPKTQVPELLSKDNIKQLHRDSEKNDKLLDFAKNPQHLKMLVKIYQKRRREGKDPEIGREVEIYDRFVDLHLEEEESRWRSEESPDVKKKALAWLAFEVLTSENLNARRFRRSWAKARLRKIISTAINDEPLDSEEIRTAVNEILAEGLIVLSPDGKRYEFSHPSLGDYFFAWHLAHNVPEEAPRIILEWINGRDLFRYFYSAYGRWITHGIWDFPVEKTIRFYVGLSDDASPFIKHLTSDRSAQGIMSAWYFLLAIQCLDEASNITLERLSEKAIEEIRNKWEHLGEGFLEKMWMFATCP